MQIIKYFILFLIFILSNIIGKSIAKKYTYRLEELKEMKSALNIFKTKIEFTYEPIPEIFLEISKNEMIFKTPLETKQETIPIEIIIKLIFFKIKNAKWLFW